jgi:hypothetical protein
LGAAAHNKREECAAGEVERGKGGGEESRLREGGEGERGRERERGWEKRRCGGES